MGKTPFATAFSVEAIIPVEVGLSSYRVENYDEENNTEQMMAELDLVEKKREQALIWTAAHNQVVAKYYNKKFRPKTFKVGDMIIKNVLVQESGLGSFGPKWDRPFRVTDVMRLGTYRLVN